MACHAILHTYGAGLPPTDPRLIESLPNQLNNFIEQAEEAITAARRLLEISADQRPSIGFSRDKKEEIIKLATEIRDNDQACECALDSLVLNWGVSISDVDRRWTQPALADHVVVTNVDLMDEIKREVIGV